MYEVDKQQNTYQIFIFSAPRCGDCYVRLVALDLGESENTLVLRERSRWSECAETLRDILRVKDDYLLEIDTYIYKPWFAKFTVSATRTEMVQAGFIFPQ